MLRATEELIGSVLKASPGEYVRQDGSTAAVAAFESARA
jgi:hypothetical protein